MMFGQKLIRLCTCAGWSEPLLVAHTTLLEITCSGSYGLIQQTFGGSKFLVLINSTVQKFTATSFQLYPYVKQHGSRSDLTIVKPDLGPNYLQKFTSTSCQLYPYVKQYGSRSDLTTVKPDLGLNYLQKFTATSFQLYPYVKQHGSKSDLTIVTPDLGPNYLQKFTST